MTSIRRSQASARKIFRKLSFRKLEKCLNVSYLPTYLSIYISACLSVCLSVYLSIYLHKISVNVHNQLLQNDFFIKYYLQLVFVCTFCYKLISFFQKSSFWEQCSMWYLSVKHNRLFIESSENELALSTEVTHRLAFSFVLIKI